MWPLKAPDTYTPPASGVSIPVLLSIQDWDQFSHLHLGLQWGWFTLFLKEFRTSACSQFLRLMKAYMKSGQVLLGTSWLYCGWTGRCKPLGGFLRHAGRRGFCCQVGPHIRPDPQSALPSPRMCLPTACRGTQNPSYA